MKVSNNYLDLTKIESNNIKHNFVFKDITKNIDFSDFVNNENLKITRNIKDNTNTITPNSIDLEIEFTKFKKNDVYFNSKLKETEELFIQDMYFDEFAQKLSIKNSSITKDDVIEIVDVFNNEEVVIFKGIVYEIKNIETYNNKKTIQLTLKDKSVNGYLYKFVEQENYKDLFFYNQNDKENSILYLLAKRIGFLDEEIEIEDIKLSDNTYLKLPSITFEKGNSIMTELVNLVESVAGNIYTTADGKLKITSILNQNDTNILDYEFNGNNILESIETKVIYPKNDKVLITYDEYIQKERQAVFVLAGKNADYKNDDAKVIVRANTEKSRQFWNINYITETVANIDKNNIEIKAYRYENSENKVEVNYSEYEIDFDKKRLRFWNSLDYDIFIEKFKIYGEPIQKVSGNSVSYTEITKTNEVEYNPINISNKYICTHSQAQELCKYKYFQKCREHRFFKFKCNSVPFLELEDVITFNYNVNQSIQLQVIGITQNHNSTELELVEFQWFSSKPQNIITYNPNYFEEDKYIISNLSKDTTYDNLTLNSTKPPAPLNFTAESEVLGVSLKWDLPNFKEIKGFYIYAEHLENTNLNNKIFVTNNNYFYRLPLGDYRFRITTISLKGIESDYSNYIRGSALTIRKNDLSSRIITTDKIAENSITANEIVSNAITADKIAANSISSDKIMANSISSDKIMANSISSDKIMANSISSDKIMANSVSLEKIDFGNKTGITKKIVDDNVKLVFDGNVEFSDNVNINGVIEGSNGLSVSFENKRTDIRGGEIIFYENKGEHLVKTRVIRKMASDVYEFNPNLTKWIDIRNYSNGVSWDDYEIIPSLNAFAENKPILGMAATVVRHKTDNNLFYINVGGINVRTQEEKLTKQLKITNVTPFLELKDESAGYYNWLTQKYVPPKVKKSVVIHESEISNVVSMRLNNASSEFTAIVTNKQTNKHYHSDSTISASGETIAKQEVVYKLTNIKLLTKRDDDLDYVEANDRSFSLNENSSGNVKIKILADVQKHKEIDRSDGYGAGYIKNKRVYELLEQYKTEYYKERRDFDAEHNDSYIGQSPTPHAVLLEYKTFCDLSVTLNSIEIEKASGGVATWFAFEK